MAHVNIHRSSLAAIAIILFCTITQEKMSAQYCQSVSTTYKGAIVFLKVERHKTATGAPDNVEGTGFLCDGRGIFLTNDHVVAPPPGYTIDGMTAWIGSRYNTQSMSQVLVIKHDPGNDLALVQMKNDMTTYLALPMGDSRTVNAGDRVCSVGFPLGRDRDISEGIIRKTLDDHGWWATDMPANRGESGAPVFSDKTGTVVGIKVAGLEDAQNYNFIIPISDASFLISQGCSSTQLPGAERPSDLHPLAAGLLSGNATVYDGFRFFSQSTFSFGIQKVLPWYSKEADIGVSNPSKSNLPAQFFLSNDSPPYTDPKATEHELANAGIVLMPTGDLDEVKECPSSDYIPNYFQPSPGRVYCVRARDGHHWAKIKVNRVDFDRVEFDYVYQPNGSRTF